MSVTAQPASLSWSRMHRAALIIVFLSVALATTLSLFVVRLVSDATSSPASSVSTVHMQPTDNGCQTDRPGIGGVEKPC